MFRLVRVGISLPAWRWRSFNSVSFLLTCFSCAYMFIFKHGGKCVARLRPNQYLHLSTRRFASRIEINPVPPPFSIVESCPSPTCQCRETPAGLDIEREHNLNGSMAPYAEQVLISTGRSDWHSRIEEDEEGVLVRELKGFLGRHGKYSDVRVAFSMPWLPVYLLTGD